MAIEYVIKRDGRVVRFDQERIRRAISRAMESVNKYTEESCTEILNQVIDTLEKLDKERVHVEEIQDIIEITLMKAGLYDVAKSFILYRKRKQEIREEKARYLHKKPNKLSDVEKRFSVNAIALLARRYLWRDPKTGEFMEDVDGLFRRVAVAGAIAEILYDPVVYDKNGGHRDVWERTKSELEELRKRWEENREEFRNKYTILRGFNLNEYHFERLLYAYEQLAKEGKMKVTIKELLKILEESPETFSNARYYVRKFYELMTNQVFMPNTPALVNAGRPLGMLSACFVVGVHDDLESIMDTAKDIALISKAGGGIGLNLSSLRPSDPTVALSTTGATSSGVVSWLNLYNSVLEQIKQGGIRRGAGMAILEYWHAQIEDFIRAKEHNRGDNVISNFNISVGTWEEFWDAVLRDGNVTLIARKQIVVKDGENYRVLGTEEYPVKSVRARYLLNIMAENAWKTGDPGVLYFDNANKYNIRKGLFGNVVSTNPCGEQFLYPYESCNLASINLEKFVHGTNGDREFDWEAYAEVIEIVARFLDNMIDINNYPLKKIEERTKAGRNIGVGIMGLANALYRLGVPYNSEEGYKLMSKFAEYLTYYSYKASIQLAKERGPFSYFEKTEYVNGRLPIRGYYERDWWTLDWDELVEEIKRHGLRNVEVTTVPPTGSVSMIADTSSGIEPNFALVYRKTVTVGEFYYVNTVLEEELKKRGLYTEELLEEIVNNYGSVQGIKKVPRDIQRVFVTAMDIHWIDHIIAQAILQMWITNSISKTINMPNGATVDDVKLAYVLAHELGCKGLTIYRDGSLDIQVLNVVGEKKYREYDQEPSKYAVKVLKELVDSKPALREFFRGTRLNSIIGGNTETPQFTFSLSHATAPSKKTSPKSHVTVSHSRQETPKDEKDLIGKVYCPVCYEERGELVELRMESGCATCPVCGWSKCEIA